MQSLLVLWAGGDAAEDEEQLFDRCWGVLRNKGRGHAQQDRELAR